MTDRPVPFDAMEANVAANVAGNQPHSSAGKDDTVKQAMEVLFSNLQQRRSFVVFRFLVRVVESCTYFSMLNCWCASTFWMNFDVQSLGFNPLAMIVMMLILLLPPAIMQIGPINRFLVPLEEEYGKAIAIFGLIMYLIAEQCNFSGAKIEGAGMASSQNIFISLSFIMWTFRDTCKLSVSEHTEVVSWFGFRSGGWVVYNFLNWATGSTNPFSAYPAFGAAVYCSVFLIEILYTFLPKSNMVKKVGHQRAIW